MARSKKPGPPGAASCGPGATFDNAKFCSRGQPTVESCRRFASECRCRRVEWELVSLRGDVARARRAGIT